ncbi:hypothetical protein HOK00_11450 [bacterium]|nr:hypothetical protein [bacterium]
MNKKLKVKFLFRIFAIYYNYGIIVYIIFNKLLMTETSPYQNTVPQNYDFD